ncbi:ATP-binding protein [Verrucomicrobiaceae bacterium 227]
MNRPWVIWSVMLTCAVLVLGMFAWITQRALVSEHERVRAEADALLGERVRLSLARMDSVGSDLLLVENLRPPMYYRSYFSPSDIVTNDLQGVEQGVVLQPSPLMTGVGDLVDLHFVVEAGGALSSPQVPLGNQRERAVTSGVDEGEIRDADVRLKALEASLPKRKDLAKLFRDEESGDALEMEVANNWLLENVGNVAPAEPKMKGAYQTQLAVREQSSRSMAFKEKVAKAAKKSEAWGAKNSPQTLSKAPQAKVKQEQDSSSITERSVSDINPDGILSVSPFIPVWKGEDLFFFRKVQRVRSISYQGFRMVRDLVEKTLMAEIPADLGEVKLARLEKPDPSALSLVSLPWKLELGAKPEIADLGLTPLRKTLIAGWSAALLALLALFLLLRGVMKLSARRAAFVSSVTHELRTPLTTFRLYSEMLLEGMVRDEEKKQDYLRTMFSESERLNHLVENVLSYARIEKGNARSKVERLKVGDLVERMRPVLQRRVDQENAALSIELEDDLAEIETDITAVEQILFNLIDNACKYGLPESGGGHVTMSVTRKNGRFTFEVCDEGRGIAGSERRRLFRAFHKSALEAAHDKPGVGLGLALCRRLARALGGDLKLGKKVGEGACFVLQLP